MNGYCPNCGREDSLALIRETEDFNVRGEIIPVEVEYYRCENCSEEIMQLQTDDDPLEKAYREYRRRKDMLQPEEIRKFRQSLGLTQKELSELLGIGVASLSRYENGALQEQAHDQILKFGMDPSNLLKLIEEKRDVLNPEKKSELTHQIQQGKESKRLIDLVYDHHGKYDASILTGFQPLQVDKLTEAIKYFCYEDRIPKTKLMKLLFYADFKHYKEYGRSITGIQYAHLPYGPVPDKYDLWISTILADNPSIFKDEVWFNENPAEIITSNESADISMFENSEVLVLATVKEIFKNFSARKITDFSHQEEGYRETRNGQIISYEYAKKLRI
jgi:putative zinc finger/helix-turn-helix YgiT family protein